MRRWPAEVNVAIRGRLDGQRQARHRSEPNDDVTPPIPQPAWKVPDADVSRRADPGP